LASFALFPWQDSQRRSIDCRCVAALGALVPDKPAYRDALMQQVGSDPGTGQRNSFQHAVVRERLGLYSHFYHWIELARLENEPPASPVRGAAPLYNIFDTRSEGLATAMPPTGHRRPRADGLGCLRARISGRGGRRHPRPRAPATGCAGSSFRAMSVHLGGWAGLCRNVHCAREIPRADGS
jgi:hypothetical protein